MENRVAAAPDDNLDVAISVPWTSADDSNGLRVGTRFLSTLIAAVGRGDALILLLHNLKYNFCWAEFATCFTDSVEKLRIML